MRVELRVRNTDLADAMRGHIEQRLGVELGRFGEQVGRVRVKISGLNDLGTKRAERWHQEELPHLRGLRALQESRRSGSRSGSACRDRPRCWPDRALAGSTT